jgi:uncharacterized spore protein YtfJ
MEQFNLVENVDTLFHSLENFTQREGVIGKAVTQSDKTFMPIVSVTIGYGGGNASMGKAQSGSAVSFSSGSGNTQASPAGATGALGFGAKLNTEAIIVIDNNNVSVLPMSTAGVGSMMDKIPQIISGMTQNKSSQSQQSQSQSNQNQGQSSGQ